MHATRPVTARLAGASVGLALAGMVAGALLVVATGHGRAGWLLFVLSFTGWLAAALLAMREGWHRGWFDR